MQLGGDSVKISDTGFKGLKVVEPSVYGDDRGWFMESYNEKKLREHGIYATFVQDNQSYSKRKGTLRGIHFQVNPKAQTKLIRCTRGSILDVVVDLRKGSDTYGKWFSIELSSENKKQLLIPKGFGHAFLTLTDDVEVQYKVDEYYSPQHDRSLRWDDPDIGIQWPIENPVLSEKDANAPLWKDSDVDFSIRVLVTGVTGQLGYDVAEVLTERGMEVCGASRDDFDLTDEEAIDGFIRNYCPDVVIHCAAFTDVDRAESERELCYTVNAASTKKIAEACKNIGAKLVYISTDYVFSGEGTCPYNPDDVTAPINYYGFTKEKAESFVREVLNEHFIVRTSWLYGVNGNNFVKTILSKAAAGQDLLGVTDQIGAPTYTRDLAEFIYELIQTDKYGTYHGVNAGYCTRYDFIRAIVEEAGLNVNVTESTSDQWNSPAKRPANSRLNPNMLDNGFTPLPPWRDALRRFLNELGEGRGSR